MNTGSILSFDPENMTQYDVINIAKNADNLIQIISNIKKTVTESGQGQPKGVNTSQNSDIDFCVGDKD